MLMYRNFQFLMTSLIHNLGNRFGGEKKFGVPIWRTKSDPSHPVTIGLKFSFSEKITKTLAMVLTFNKYINFKTIRTIGHIFVAFSERLNFN